MLAPPPCPARGPVVVACGPEVDPRMRLLPCVVLLLSLATPVPSPAEPAPTEKKPPAPLPTSAPPADAIARILGAAVTDQGAWRRLEYLTTRIGHRLSGSASLEKANHWAADEMRKEGLENVRLQPAKVPHWVRGRE